MDTNILLEQIETRREPEHRFICWDRGEGGRECELLDYFVRVRAAQEEVAAFELLDMEQMWEELLALGVPGFKRVVRKGVEAVDWTYTDADGEEKVRSCCFRAEGLSALYDEVKALRQSV